MEFLQILLPIIIYILLIIILIVGIILGIKTIRAVDRMEQVVEDVNQKVKSLNSLFHIIDFTTDKLVSLSDVLVDKLSQIVTNLFFNKKKKSKKEED